MIRVNQLVVIPLVSLDKWRLIDLSYRSYFHCRVSLDYMKSNWDKVPHTSLGVDDNVMKEKINYFPLGVGQPRQNHFHYPIKRF